MLRHILQPESDGSRSGSSLSLRNIAGNDVAAAAAAAAAASGNSSVQSPTHRGVHRSISASNTKPGRRASSGAETLRENDFCVAYWTFVVYIILLKWWRPPHTAANRPTGRPLTLLLSFFWERLHPTKSQLFVHLERIFHRTQPGEETN